MADAPQLIVVTAGEPGRVGLWEVHPKHPGGEVWVADNEQHQVYPTPKVNHALRIGQLVKVDGGTAVPDNDQNPPPDALFIAQNTDLFEGLGEATATKLATAGVHTTDELANLTDQDVQGLHENYNLPVAKLEAWITTAQELE